VKNYLEMRLFGNLEIASPGVLDARIHFQIASFSNFQILFLRQPIFKLPHFQIFKFSSWISPFSNCLIFKFSNSL